MGVADQFYQSIDNVELPDGSSRISSLRRERGVTSVVKSMSGHSSSLLALLVLLLCAAAAVVHHRSFSSPASSSSGASSSSSHAKKRADASSFSQYIPPGVNLASWYSLEDWSFAGDRGAIEVATPDDDTAGNCLPPLHVDGSTGPRWNSETDLLAGLVRHYHDGGSSKDESSSSSSSSPNPRSSSATVDAAASKEVEDEEGGGGGGLELGPWGKAIRTIHAFRSSYYDVETELRTMSELGIEYVRIPVSWCWTDYDPSYLYTLLPTPSDNSSNNNNNDNDNYSYMTDDEIKHKFTCEDPYYPNVRWPAIGRPHFRRLLRACAEYGIGATIDLHTYPGGTSIGTFSGVWPRYPKFWTNGDVPSTATLTSSGDTSDNGGTDVGRTLLANFIRWMESLEVSDPIAFKGIRALSPMNEPAHLAGLFNGPNPKITNRKTFLPPLPPKVASDYLLELNADILQRTNKTVLTEVPDGAHLRVLLWLRDAVHAFRSSNLTARGKELHVNLHESIFDESTAPDYYKQLQIFGAWWRVTTTPVERKTWAVFDGHHYQAWGDKCQGSIDGPPTSSYACSDSVTRDMVFAKCADWPFTYRAAMEGECGVGLRLASAEFSASTHHSVRHACNDVTTLRMMLETQIKMAKLANVELFFWAYKMPYGGAFRYAWSLKHLLYLLGVLPKPDEELFHCGDHIQPPGEPKDSSI